MGVDEGGYQFQARIFEAGRVVAIPLLGAMANVRNTRKSWITRTTFSFPAHGSRISSRLAAAAAGGRLAARAVGAESPTDASARGHVLDRESNVLQSRGAVGGVLGAVTFFFLKQRGGCHTCGWC